MRAMQLTAPGTPLRMVTRPDPKPAPGQVTVRVSACGVCRTDLHVTDGDLPAFPGPIIPGHEIVGRVADVGEAVEGVETGMRVGIPWLGGTCGQCRYCEDGRENLCDAPVFTGYTADGGYASHAIADARFVLPISGDQPDVETAPLLCAGLIGYRCLRKAGDPARLGLYGFGAAAHIVAQLAKWEGREIYAFTRPEDRSAQAFALDLGCVWAAGSDSAPPEPLDAAIIFAPVGSLVPRALRAVRKGGRVVCGGIHMSDIPSFPYAMLWEEREIVSVANLTRDDGHKFLALAPKIPVKTHTIVYPLDRANDALEDLRAGRFAGAAVLVP